MSEFSMMELRDMAPAYVLGALSADEMTLFERAMTTSAELLHEVQAYQSVVTRIGSASELTPPADVRARFLGRIASSSQLAPPVVSHQPDVVDAPLRPFTVSTGNAAAHTTVGSKPAERWWLVGVLALGLAATLLFAVQRNSEVSTLTATLAQRDSVLGQRDSVLAVRDIKLAQRDSALNTVLEAERSLVMVNLVSTDTGPGIQFFWDVQKGRGMIHAFRLKPAAAGRTYQLWLIKDGKPVPSRLFNADPDAHGLVWGIELPTDLTGVTAVAVTDEPAGGSPQPTTTPFMAGALPKAIQ